MLQNLPQEEQWRIVFDRDPEFDGRLFFGVSSTGIYCRPSCPSKRPKPENVRFFGSVPEAEAAGFRACLRCRPQSIAALADLARKVTGYIDAHLHEPITLEQLSAAAGVSPFHLHRSFKRATGVTPKAYLNERRTKAFAESLPEAQSITAAIYDAGFGASSRAYESSTPHLGMKPGERRKRGAGVSIQFTIAPTEFGQLLVATTERGVCAVRLADTRDELETGFRADFSKASIVRDDDRLATIVDQILVLIGGAAPHPEVPVDVRATAFQRRVWEYLRTIPRGETRSYSQVARDIGAPTSTRAVARACATNEVALVVPCHRVVAADGKLTGFRWGVERKRKLLERERNC